MSNPLDGIAKLPPIVIDHDELLGIPVHKRVAYVMKKYLSDGNIVEKTKVLQYFAEALIGVVESISNPLVKNYLGVFRNGISMYELNTIFTNLIKVEKNGIEYITKEEAMKEVIKENFFHTPMIFTWNDDNDAIRLIIQNIAKTPASIADKYNLKILAKEEIKETYSSEAIIVCEMNGDKFAISYEEYEAITGVCSRNKEDYAVYMPWEDGEDNSVPYTRCLQIINILNKMSIEVFCHRINPSINYVTIDKEGYQIHTKKEVYETIFNLDYDDLTQSMEYCLEHNKKRGIAMVGDPGLGKTICIHKLINHFKNVPTFIVRNEALLDVSSIRKVFNLVRDMKAILVFDDFDGLEVQDKGPITNEFLHQMDVSGEFKGIIIATINDPSKVHYTLISRPERFDEVILMRYPEKHEEIEEIILNKLKHISETDETSIALIDKFKTEWGTELYNKFIATCAENKFSPARISSTIDYCLSHFQKLSSELLIKSSEIAIGFQKTSKMFSENGELKHSNKAKLSARKSDWAD